MPPRRAWIALVPPSFAISASATSLAVAGSDVFVGGWSSGASETVPGYWKIGQWTSFPGFTSHSSTYRVATVNTIVVTDTAVYAGGQGPQEF